MSQNNGKITAKIFGGSNCFDSKQASKQAHSLIYYVRASLSLALNNFVHHPLNGQDVGLPIEGVMHVT